MKRYARKSDRCKGDSQELFVSIVTEVNKFW